MANPTAGTISVLYWEGPVFHHHLSRVWLFCFCSLLLEIQQGCQHGGDARGGHGRKPHVARYAGDDRHGLLQEARRWGRGGRARHGMYLCVKSPRVRRRACGQKDPWAEREV